MSPIHCQTDGHVYCLFYCRKGYNFSVPLKNISDYLTTYCRNFIMAFPLQLIIVGPLARLIFRTLFIKRKKVKSTSEIQNEDAEIVKKTV